MNKTGPWLETKPDWWTVAPNLPNAPADRYTSMFRAVKEAFAMLDHYAEVVLTRESNGQTFVVRRLET